ncbi:MAG: isoprenylcysteine carboxylmethyltransferase family protein [Planctomycetota bacterium]|nr:isoprenylcysteine carboxylmethyltransferase family protein [Planctomycetota bacterium]
MKKILKLFHFRSRTGLGFLAAFFLLVTAKPTPFWLAVAGSLAIIGAAIRIWASGTLLKDEVLARTGPYAFTRNPLYLGSILIGIGFALANQDLFFVGAAGLVLGLRYGQTITKEEEKLRAKFGDDFVAYCGEVPRLLPFPGKLPARGAWLEGFSVRQAVRNQEAEAAFGILALLLALAYPAWTRDYALFRVVVCVAMGAFLIGRAALFPLLKSDSKNRLVNILQYAFSRKKYEKLRSG